MIDQGFIKFKEFIMETLFKIIFEIYFYSSYIFFKKD